MKTNTDLPQEIAPDVYCLGSRELPQTNIYLVRAGSSWALIDAGWAKDGPRIRKAAESLFGSGTRPAAILLTHCHPDHEGSALQLALEWKCAVYVHPDELPIAVGDWTAINKYAGPLDNWIVLPLMRAMGRQRREAMLSRSSLKDVVRTFDATGMVPGLAGWEYIPTAGHTPGHVSFLRTIDRVLITGDAVVTLELNSVLGLVLQRQGLSGPPWYTSWNWSAVKESAAALARLEPHVLATGHGECMAGASTAQALGVFANRFSGRAAIQSVDVGRGTARRSKVR